MTFTLNLTYLHHNGKSLLKIKLFIASATDSVVKQALNRQK